VFQKAGAKVLQKSEKSEEESEKFLHFNYFLCQSPRYMQENA
jgi:hypothetical protein